MSRVYEHICNNGIKVGLYKRLNYSGSFPYVLKRGNLPIAEIEYFGDANREYHQTIREEEKMYA